MRSRFGRAILCLLHEIGFEFADWKTTIWRMKPFAWLGLLLLGSASTGLVARSLVENAELVWFLENHALPPDRYIVEKFRTWDVVLMGEDHAVRENLGFVRDLLPALQRAGIHNLGMEFGAEEDQAELDQLIQAAVFDEERARELMFSYNVGWAFREYLELYRAAWETNRNRGPGERPFRILNLSYRFDWSRFEGVRTPAALRRIFHRGPIEPFRAQRIEREIFAVPGEKILVLTGHLHAFTRYAIAVEDYNSPNFVRFDDRHLGNLLHRRHPGKVGTIFLHQPFPGESGGWVQPASGNVERAMSSLPGRALGFDVLGTPFGRLRDGSAYAAGVTDFSLGDLVDGYVFLAPIARQHGCTIDEGFLTERRWERARGQIPDVGLAAWPATREEYLARIRRYVDLDQRYRGLR